MFLDFTFDVDYPLYFPYLLILPYICAVIANLTIFIREKTASKGIKAKLIFCFFQFLSIFVIWILINLFLICLDILSMSHEHFDEFSFVIPYFILVIATTITYYFFTKYGGFKKRELLRGIMLPALFIILIPAYLYMKVEFLTCLHGREFTAPIRKLSLPSGYYYKILSYDKSGSKLYIDQISEGNYLFYQKNKAGNWTLKSTTCLWGPDSATKTPWPPY